MNAKSKVLLSSIASIALCSSIAVGGTYALFTSESKVNIAVTSGQVKVVATADNLKLYSMDTEQEKTFELGGTAELSDNQLTLTNITPGDKATFEITVDNTSNVTVQYRMTMSIVEVLEDGSEATATGLVSKATVDGITYNVTASSTPWQTLAANTDPSAIEVSVELPEAAGNEYQNKQWKIVYMVEAVQGNANYVEASDNETLDAAIENGESVIKLGSGNYILPDSAKGKTLTIIGNGETVVATQDDGSYEGCDYSLDGATVTFENVTINTTSKTYTGYARLKATYNNCTINGTYTLYGDSVFNNCTFNVSGDVYNIWTWGAPNATFNGCTFNSDGKALLLYGQANTNLTVNNCTFNDNGGLTDLKAAIEIGNDYNKSYTLTVNNTTVNGYEINDKGISTGTTLWGNKNSMDKDHLNVVVNGVDVY